MAPVSLSHHIGAGGSALNTAFTETTNGGGDAIGPESYSLSLHGHSGVGGDQITVFAGGDTLAANFNYPYCFAAPVPCGAGGDCNMVFPSMDPNFDHAFGVAAPYFAAADLHHTGGSGDHNTVFFPNIDALATNAFSLAAPNQYSAVEFYYNGAGGGLNTEEFYYNAVSSPNMDTLTANTFSFATPTHYPAAELYYNDVGGEQNIEEFYYNGASGEQNMAFPTMDTRAVNIFSFATPAHYSVEEFHQISAGGEQNMVSPNIDTPLAANAFSFVAPVHYSYANADLHLHAVDAGGEQDTVAANVDVLGIPPAPPSPAPASIIMDNSQPSNHLTDATVKSVWRENCTEQFKLVVDALNQPRRHLYIAVDMEFAADATTNIRRRPVTSTGCYHHLREFVNRGDIVQMGLAFVFVGDGEQSSSSSSSSPPPITLEINFKINIKARKYNKKSISFQSRHGHDLREHRRRGVSPRRVYEGLLRHLPFGDGRSVTWLAYHGDYDLGFLLLLLQRGGRRRGGGDLPRQLAAFLRRLREDFPAFYDVRVIRQMLEDHGFNGKLTGLAEHLGIRRTGGAAHHAGSDALLTLSCFFKIFRSLSGQQLHQLDARRGLLAGLEEWNMAIKCARHIDDHTRNIKVIEVVAENLGEEARRIGELVASNFSIIGVEVNQVVIHPRLDRKGYEIIIAFMNPEGMLAYGRAWKFCISRFTSDNNGYVLNLKQLAELMQSCGATNNPDVSWVTFQGSDVIYRLIRSANNGGIPSSISGESYFPSLYDVALIVRGFHGIGTLPTTDRKVGIFDVARALKLKAIKADKEAERVLLTLRCFMRLAELIP
uniref:Uncharacterized protein n=1 Tax=Oryza meridionalis TaxID=40149 RepID=A0A0E0EY01_9ORYZ